MARIHRNNIVQLVLGNEGFEQLSHAVPEPTLEPDLITKVAHFMLFLAEVEECAHALRDDEVEKMIEAALAAAGFAHPSQVQKGLQWVFGCPEDLS